MPAVETPAERNRRLFPGMAEFVDDMRRVFGDVKVRFVENTATGDKVGTPLDADIQGYWTADQWLHMGSKVEPTKDVMARAKADQKRMEDTVKKGKGGKK